MIGIYFSGTGNTAHCVDKIVKLIDGSSVVLPLEGDSAKAAIAKSNVIVFGYGVQYSDMPFFVRQFIVENKELWKGKNILCVATMGAFSGDGAGCSARLFKKYGATILGGLHIVMPDSICDFKQKKDEEVDPEKLYLESLKHEGQVKKLHEDRRNIIRQADERIEKVASDIKNGKYPKDGLGLFNRLAGFFGQRLWLGKRSRRYGVGPKIDEDLCDGCRICIQQCPLKNLSIEEGIAQSAGRCTTCYRCVNRCPKKAITLLGDKVEEQYKIERYL